MNRLKMLSSFSFLKKRLRLYSRCISSITKPAKLQPLEYCCNVHPYEALSVLSYQLIMRQKPLKCTVMILKYVCISVNLRSTHSVLYNFKYMLGAKRVPETNSKRRLINKHSVTNIQISLLHENMVISQSTVKDSRLFT